MKVFKELFSFIIKKRATQKEIPGGFYLSTTVTICIHSAMLCRSLAIADRLGALVGKKNLEITKMADHFSHTKKKDFKTAKAERSFFVLISLFKST